MTFERKQISTLHKRLRENPTSMIFITGPGQIGKSTLVVQALLECQQNSYAFIAADQPVASARSASIISDVHARMQTPPGFQPTTEWLVNQWILARAKAKALPIGGRFILVIDGVQKFPNWSEVVKGLWDEDRMNHLQMHVVLLGSSPLLMQRGLTESLAGRFEIIRMTHWSYMEMRAAFDFTLEEYIYFGGYPGKAATLIREEQRWRDYIRYSLIQPNIEKDILQMTRVDKPALLKTLFELGCAYSGQITSYTNLLGQLKDAGNTVTLAHYLDLLSRAGLLTALTKYTKAAHRQRASSPKLNVLNTALMSTLTGYSFDEARADRSYWGKLVESAVGAHLFNTASDYCKVHYWRESPHEVDFILTNGRICVAIEVKSGANYSPAKGLNYFIANNKEVHPLLVGPNGISFPEFFSRTADEWLSEGPSIKCDHHN